MTMHATIAARITVAGARPTIPTAIFAKPGDDYTARRDSAQAQAMAWDAAIRHIIADAVRTGDDQELDGLAYIICPAARIEDGSVDRKMLAAAIISSETDAARLARLFLED